MFENKLSLVNDKFHKSRLHIQLSPFILKNLLFNGENDKINQNQKNARRHPCDEDMYLYDEDIYLYDEDMYLYDEDMYLYDEHIYLYDENIYVQVYKYVLVL